MESRRIVVADEMWIESLGGPLVGSSNRVFRLWAGAQGRSFAVEDYSTDYDFACDVKEFIEKRTFLGEEIFVMGDEPLRTFFVRRNEHKIFLLRQIWSNVEFDEVKSYIVEYEADIEKKCLQNSINFIFPPGGICIFDSALGGEGKYIEIECEDKVSSVIYTYRIQEKRFDFIVHEVVLG